MRVCAAPEATPRHWARLAPSFSQLPRPWRELITAGFKTEFLLGQFGQMENVAASLLPLAELMTRSTCGGAPDDEFDGARAVHFYLLMQVTF